jgi:histone-lysine N-methyltransferase ASH1L
MLTIMQCYYLMSFDQNMIIDATRGSIARFVNHSCEPNCRMVKWIVAGKPRMALFAGDKPIMTGEELTYDYNFDPFSAKNVQECRCGSKNCRGVLGPRPKDWQKTNRAQTNKALQSAKEVVKAGKEAGKKALKGAVGAVTAGKRKLKELLGGEDDDEASEPKKRKLAKANSQKAGPRTIQAVKRSPHTSKVVARAKKGVKSVGNKIRLEVTKMSKKTVDGRNQESLTVKKLKTPKKTRLLKTYAAVKAGSRLKGLRQTKLVMGSSTSSLTFAEGDGSEATATPKTSPNTKTPKSTATPKSIGKEEAKAVRGSGKKVTARVVATVSPRAGKRNVVLSVKGRAMKELGEALAARDAAKSASPKGKSPKTLGRKKTIRVISP